MNQPGLSSNQVHLALFFRIAELLPQDDSHCTEKLMTNASPTWDPCFNEAKHYNLNA